MSDEPDSLVLRMLRQIDTRLDRMEGNMIDMKLRQTMMERQLGSLIADEQGHYAVVMSRFDSLERRVDRIERRLDPAEASPA